MARRVGRGAVVPYVAALTVSWLTGCTGTEGQHSDSGPRLVQQVQLNRAGVPVEPVTPDEAADPSGSGTAVCPPLSIAIAGPLTGPASALGINVNNGMQLAVDRHNASNRGCQIQLQPFDTWGDPAAVGDIAATIGSDAFTVGLVGGSTSPDDAREIDEALARTGMAAPSIAGLSSFHSAGYLQGAPGDAVEGTAVARYMTETLGFQRVCVIADDARDSTDLAEAVRKGLGRAADADCAATVGSAPEGSDAFGDALTRIAAAQPDAVYFSSSQGLATPFLERLRASDVTADFVASGRDAGFVAHAGKAAEGTLLSCACSPAPEPFAEEYATRFSGQRPGPFAVEGYDLATIMLAGIDAGAITRPDLLTFMRSYDGEGLAGRYRWTQDGELVDPRIWIYAVQ